MGIALLMLPRRRAGTRTAASTREHVATARL